MGFEWDQRKDAANRRKHHVSFLEAQHGEGNKVFLFRQGWREGNDSEIHCESREYSHFWCWLLAERTEKI